MELKHAASQGPLGSATWTSQDTTVHHTEMDNEGSACLSHESSHVRPCQHMAIQKSVIRDMIGIFLPCDGIADVLPRALRD